MKFLLLASVSALALSTTSANALQVFLDATPGTTIFTATTAGAYEIDVYGAQGGSSFYNGKSGGRGVGVGNILTLSAGERLNVVVGARGASGEYAGGGGGGSVVINGGQGVWAGGGGGAGYHGVGADATNACSSFYACVLHGPPSYQAAGGRGFDYFYGGGGGGGGGGGFISSGADGGPGYSSRYRRHYSGGRGGLNGNVGSGGGAGRGAYGGGGGGGGIYGGAGGDAFLGGRGGSGYGGATLGFELGDGKVIIDQLAAPAPEPSTWSLMLTGLGFLGYVLRRRVLRRA